MRVANLRKVQNAGKTLKSAKKELKSFRKATVNENAKGKSQTTNAVKSLGNCCSAGSKMPCLPTLFRMSPANSKHREGKIEEKPTHHPEQIKIPLSLSKKGCKAHFCKQKCALQHFVQCKLQWHVVHFHQVLQLGWKPRLARTWFLANFWPTFGGAYSIFGQFLAYFWWGKCAKMTGKVCKKAVRKWVKCG